MSVFAEQTLSVSQLNGYLRALLASDLLLGGLLVRGEISGFKRHVSGHLYFSIKDEKALIRCVMFKQNTFSLRIAPKDGMRVVLGGYVSFYERDGALQFYCESMQADGLGDLHLAFEALKEKLAAEGLFAQERKRPLPSAPRRIAVVTSATGAAVGDVLRVAARRDPGMPIVVVPTQVQGEGAAQSIVQALRKAAALPDVDIIICGRGGGSIEDLWAFNEEIVARAIAACKVPIIAAVGHEIDVSIADFVADVRAATPSQAAELAVPETINRAERWGRARQRLYAVMERRLQREMLFIQQIASRNALRTPRAMLQAWTARADALQARLARSIQMRTEREGLHAAMFYAKLDALSPLSVLARGYAVVEDARGMPVRDEAHIAPNAQFFIRLHQGRFAARREAEHAKKEDGTDL